MASCIFPEAHPDPGLADIHISVVHIHTVSSMILIKALMSASWCRRGQVTRLGKLMVEFPLPPNLTRALLKAAALMCEDVMLPVAAMLSVENIFIRPGKYFCLLSYMSITYSWCEINISV